MNRYRAANGSWYLKALFFETTAADKTTVLYTLKDEDHKGHPSLYRLYMAMDDITEWEFSQTYFYSWEHWTILCECTWFKDTVERWRKELLLRTQAQALRAIKLEAADGKNAYHANKYLLEAGWQEPDGKKRGRPSKEEVKKEADIKAESLSRIAKDYKRIKLHA